MHLRKILDFGEGWEGGGGVAEEFGKLIEENDVSLIAVVGSRKGFFYFKSLNLKKLLQLKK